MACVTELCLLIVRIWCW